MEKISGVYKIENIITGDFYIGSSKDIKLRWVAHRCPSSWKHLPNNPMYKDMQKYGIDKFQFQILEQVIPECLKQAEQEFIEMLQPTYNNYRANGIDVERQKKNNLKHQKKYRQSNKGKENYKKYNHSDKGKESRRKYSQSEKSRKYQMEYNHSDAHRKSINKYNNQLCSYNGEIITLSTLSSRFYRAGIEHPTLEAKKYLITK